MVDTWNNENGLLPCRCSWRHSQTWRTRQPRLFTSSRDQKWVEIDHLLNNWPILFHNDDRCLQITSTGTCWPKYIAWCNCQAWNAAANAPLIERYYSAYHWTYPSGSVPLVRPFDTVSLRYFFPSKRTAHAIHSPIHIGNGRSTPNFGRSKIHVNRFLFSSVHTKLNNLVYFVSTLTATIHAFQPRLLWPAT